ncbi:hypothetical protein CK203_088932, partial [Vitis vinifera]
MPQHHHHLRTVSQHHRLYLLLCIVRLKVAPPPAIVPTPISEDPHARMDKLEQKLRQMRTSEGAITWEDFDGAPVASLPAKAHGLDDAQMVMLFPMSLSGCTALVRFIGEEGIARGLWSESSPTDSKGKRPSGGQRSGDVGAISSAGMRPSRRYQTVGQTPGYYYPPSPHAHYRPPTPSRPMTPTYLHPLTACFCCTRRREASCPIYSTPSSTDHYLCAEATTSVCSVGYAFESSFSEAHRGWIMIPLASRPLPQPIPPRFRMDLHCSYHQGPGHDTDHCTALRHAIQDLIDQG